MVLPAMLLLRRTHQVKLALCMVHAGLLSFLDVYCFATSPMPGLCTCREATPSMLYSDQEGPMGRKNTALKVVEEDTPQPLTEREQKFISLLLTGMTISEAAITAGVRRSVAFHWMASPHCQIYQEYVIAQIEKEQAFRNRITQLRDKALSAIEASLSEEAPPAVRLAAAKFVHEQSSVLRDRTTSPERLVKDEIERYSEAIDHHNRTVVAMYDAKGLRRMGYDNVANDAFE